MVIHFELTNGGAKAVFLGLAMVFCGGLVALAAAQFVIRHFSDERYEVRAEILASAASHFPSSARLNGRLAEAGLSASLAGAGDEAAQQRAAVAAASSVRLSPWNYRYRLTQAAILESMGHVAGAETALRVAAELAPAHREVRWRLANLLLRNGQTDAALAEFKVAAGSAALLPTVIDTVWAATGGDLAAVSSLVGEGDGAAGRVALARYLVRRGAADEALKLLGAGDPQVLRSSPPLLAEVSRAVDELIAGGRAAAAQALWARLAGHAGGVVWDGGFEAEAPEGLPQFAWRLKSSGFARVGVAAEAGARGGKRCLKIEFTGRDTTRLEQEATQLIVLRPGARYRIEGYATTEGLETPEGPRLAVLHGQAVVAETPPVKSGGRGWERLTADFTAPPGAGTLTVAVRRVPRFAYDEPTRGAVLFDDVSVAELN